jgi:hypothetical protein
MVDKYINKNGDVAVIVSPGYGGGYSEDGLSVFDPEVVRLILNYPNDPHGSKAAYKKLMVDKYNKDYAPDFGQLEVEWLKPGTEFRIAEYDGYETIELKEETSWHVA